MMRTEALEGLRVADFSWAATGPLISKWLAEHGAEVIRIETTKPPDPLRTWQPFRDGRPGLNRAAFFAIFNNDKYGISLNLSHPRGIEVAKRIVAWADIVLESFTPGVMERLGLGYDELRKIKPDIIMLSCCNQGQTGPHALHPGFGPHLSSLTGFVNLTGWPDRGPAMLSVAYTDIVVPRFGVVILLAALDYRHRTGRGIFLDLSQYEASIQFMAPLILDYSINGRIANRMGNRSACAAPHGVYPCKGIDRWCVIAVFTDEEWEGLCKAMGNPTWVRSPKFNTLRNRKQNEDELDKLVEEWTINFTAEEVMARLQSFKVNAGVVVTCDKIYQDAQLKYRHHFWELEHPEIGRHYYEGPAFQLSKTPAKLQRAAPCLGEHNEYVCTKVLGMSDEEFVELLATGIFD